MTAQGQDNNQIWVSAEAITNFSHAILRAAGADEATATTTTDAMMHASLHGVDSHGFRLLPHYQAVMRGGRVNPRPNLKFTKTRAGTGTLDDLPDHGMSGQRLQHLAGRTARGAARLNNGDGFLGHDGWSARSSWRQTSSCSASVIFGNRGRLIAPS